MAALYREINSQTNYGTTSPIVSSSISYTPSKTSTTRFFPISRIPHAKALKSQPYTAAQIRKTNTHEPCLIKWRTRRGFSTAPSSSVATSSLSPSCYSSTASLVVNIFQVTPAAICSRLIRTAEPPSQGDNISLLVERLKGDPEFHAAAHTHGNMCRNVVNKALQSTLVGLFAFGMGCINFACAFALFPRRLWCSGFTSRRLRGSSGQKHLHGHLSTDKIL